MPAGRPKKYKTPESLKSVIDEYFGNEKTPTIYGLCLALDIDRSTLFRYEKDQEYRNIVKRAKQRVAEPVERALLSGKGNVAGAIFWLKANAGWKETQHMEISGPDGGPIETKSEISRKIKLIEEARAKLSD